MPPSTSKSDAQARKSLDDLCMQVTQLLESNRDLSKRIKRMESRLARSYLTGNRGSDLSSLYSFQSYSSKNSIMNDRIGFAFERILQVSRVYTRALLRYPNNSTESLTSSTVSRKIGWSFFSGLTLSDISHISVLSLPICPSEISNSECYSFGTATGQDHPEPKFDPRLRKPDVSFVGISEDGRTMRPQLRRRKRFRGRGRGAVLLSGRKT